MLRGVKDYVRAESIEEALRVLGGASGEVHLLAGGTDLLFVDRAYETLLDIGRLGLDAIREEGDDLVLGATAPIEAIARSPLVEAYAGGILSASCRQFGTYPIRNMATIGGNVANAMPAADPPSALLALDARVVARSARGVREIALGELFVGPRRTRLAKEELITEIRIPRGFREWRGKWNKIGRVVRDIALANAGVSARFEGPAVVDARIALCAVAPTPIRLPEAEALLRGKVPTAALIDEVAAAVRRGVRPISDHRASEAYRRHVSGVLVRRALSEIAGIREA